MGCTTSATASGSSNRLVLRQAMASMGASIGCHGRFLPGIESAILSPRSGGLYNHLNRMFFYSQHCGGQRLIEPGAGPLAQFVTLGYFSTMSLGFLASSSYLKVARCHVEFCFH